MKSNTRKSILNWIKTQKYLLSIKELNDEHHRQFRFGKMRPVHYGNTTLARLDGDDFSKQDLLNAINKFDDSAEIQVAVHGDYEWGYSLEFSTATEDPYTDEQWLNNIVQADFRLGGSFSIFNSLASDFARKSPDYCDMIGLAGDLNKLLFTIQHKASIEQVISIEEFLTFQLGNRLLLEMVGNGTTEPYLKTKSKHANFFKSMFGDEDYLFSYYECVSLFSSKISEEL